MPSLVHNTPTSAKTALRSDKQKTNGYYIMRRPSDIIIIFINCNWVVTLWQWLFYMYTKHEIVHY